MAFLIFFPIRFFCSFLILLQYFQRKRINIWSIWSYKFVCFFFNFSFFKFSYFVRISLDWCEVHEKNMSWISGCFSHYCVLNTGQDSRTSHLKLSLYKFCAAWTPLVISLIFLYFRISLDWSYIWLFFWSLCTFIYIFYW